MPKTVQIRDIDDAVYASLAVRAAEAGLTVPDLLRREAARLASRPTMNEWFERTRRRPSAITTAEMLSTLDAPNRCVPTSLQTKISLHRI